MQRDSGSARSHHLGSDEVPAVEDQFGCRWNRQHRAKSSWEHLHVHSHNRQIAKFLVTRSAPWGFKASHEISNVKSGPEVPM